MSSKLISDENLLEIKDIIAYYGKNYALKGVSLDIPNSMIIALIGSNGAGKSTLLRVISGLMQPTSGIIFFRNNRIDRLPAHKIASLGIAHVPEGRRLFTKLNILDNLQIASRSRKRTVEVMDRVFQHFPRLKERLKQRASTLSGGEQQMLAIGRGLMAEPKLLLLDEPSLGLSPIMIEEIAKIICEINREGTTILLAEQNARLALKLSQNAYVLETGKITLKGSTRELIENESVKKAYLSA